MKTSKVFLLISLSVFAWIASAQESEFFVEAGVRYNLRDKFLKTDIPLFGGPRSGPGIEITPSWRINKNQSYGIKLGYNLITEKYQTDAIGTFKIFSMLPTYRYTFTDNLIKPFVGLGAGGFTTISGPSNFAPGFSISTGITIDEKLNFSIEYDKMLAKLKVDQAVWGAFENWYFVGVKLSYNISFGK